AMRREGLLNSMEALHKANRHLDALAACRQLMLEEPDNLEHRRKSVRFLIDSAQPETALQLLEELLRDDPDNVGLRLARVEATFNIGEIEQGIKEAEALLQIDAENVE